MNYAARILIVLIAVAESIAWGRVISGLSGLGNAFGGSGDGIGGAAGGGELLAWIFILIAWLFLASPYVCLAAACLGLIERRRLRGFYVYSFGVLGLITLAFLGMLLAEMLAGHFETGQAGMVLGNVVMFVLWMYPGIKTKR